MKTRNNFRTLTYDQHLELCHQQELEAEKGWYEDTEVDYSDL